MITVEQYNRSICRELEKGRRLLTPNEMNDFIQLVSELGGSTCRTCPEVMERAFQMVVNQINEFKQNNKVFKI